MQDTLENVSHELDCIFETGCYRYVLSSHGGKNTIEMSLEYQAAAVAKRLPEVFRQDSTSSGLSFDEVEEDTGYVAPDQVEPKMRIIVEKLRSEQIADFVQKLGIMESKKDEKQIDLFLDINEVITLMQ